MPELPEAETVKTALSHHLPGRTIADVEVFTPKLREPLTPLLEAELSGRTVIAVRRRARYILIDLDDGRSILVHLGMTGVVRIEEAAVPRRKHEHLFLHLDDGRIFRFECTRRFSIVKVCCPETPGGDPPELVRLGVEPLEPGFTAELLYGKSRGKKGALKNFLMDNTVVVGVGNIYAAEALFRARLHPARAAGRVTRPAYARLAAAVREVLREAIAAGGTTIADFRQLDGSAGAFDRELRVYGRAGEACVVCGTAIEQLRLGGRSSFYCPRCQK